MRRVWRFLGILVVVAVVAAGAAVLLTQYGEIDPIAAPDEFAADLVADGELLAAVGDCAVCHTRDGGPVNAGGRALETPFGVVHSTNITPDPETGIGRWSLEAFVRAMREGVDREGNHLYPVFPYDHFRLVTDEDMRALYAYLMAQPPVAEEPVENELDFPFNMRFLVAGWNVLYLEEGVFEADPERDDEWNRGRYLVEGLGHCGACHSPRDGFGGILTDAAFDGGEAEGWHAFALDEGSPAPVPWEVDPMVNYLIDGWDRDHGIAAGPMTPVVDSIALLPEDDVYAIAAYVVSLQGEPGQSARDDALAFAQSREFDIDGAPEGTAERIGGSPELELGAAKFEEVCANCHRAESETVPLALTSTVNGPDPRNVIQVILHGIAPPQGSPSRTMRAFGNSLSDQEVAALIVFLRAQFSQKPAWNGVPEAIAAARDGH